MGMKEMLARQHAYGIWAGAKIFKRAGQLSNEQYFAESEFGSFGSLHMLLVHMVRTEWLWRSLAATGTLPGPPPGEETFPTFADVEAGWQTEQIVFRDYLGSLSEDDLEANVDTVSPAGQSITFVRWEMLQHLLLHSMQHRTEAATIWHQPRRIAG